MAMDEEAKRAIDEALHIIQDNTQEQEPVGLSVETNHQPEEEPTSHHPDTPPSAPHVLPEATEPASNEVPRSHKKQWPMLLLIMGGSLSLTLVVALVVLPLFRTSATVTIIPSVKRITTTTVLTVQGRVLTPLTLTQSGIAPTSGTGHQSRTRHRNLLQCGPNRANSRRWNGADRT